MRTLAVVLFAPQFDLQVYSVASPTPISRATSDTFRPASIRFNSPMICSSVYRVYFVYELLLSLQAYRSSSVFFGGVLGGGQVTPAPGTIPRSGIQYPNPRL